MSNDNHTLDNLSYPTMNPAPQELKTAQSRNITLEDWNRTQLRLSLMENFLSWLLNEYTPAVKNSFDNAENDMEAAFEAYINSHPFALESYVDAGLATKQNALSFDSTPTSESTNPVTSGGVKAALDTKQNTLTFDASPTLNSQNPVTSGGIKAALDALNGTIPLFKTISAPLSSTLTNDEKAAIISGAYIAEWGSIKQAVFFPANKYNNTWYGLLVYNTAGTREVICQYYINDLDNRFTYTDTTLYIESGAIKTINNKTIPSYPSSTGTFVFESVNGTLSWVEDQDIIFVTDTLPTATASSPDFVQYNGKLYRKVTTTATPSTITDLTGTTWLLNDSLGELPVRTRELNVSYNINFDSNSASYDRLDEIGGAFYYTVRSNQTTVYQGGTPDDDGWVNDAYKTIAITGGNDVEDSGLIAWFQDNATCQAPLVTTYSYEVVIPLDSTPTANSANGVTSGGVKSALNSVEAIALGTQSAVAFSNYSTMVSMINSLASSTYKVGKNIYIVTIGVPDLWVSSVESSSSTYTYTTDAALVSELETNDYVQIGYYRLSKLETGKVDLSGFINNISAAGTNLSKSNGTVNIPAMSENTYGVAMAHPAYGIKNFAGQYLGADTGSNYSSLPDQYLLGKGTMENVKYDIVKSAMCNGVGAAWSSAEQAAGRARMGIIDDDPESYTIATSSWSALSNSSPFTYSTTVTATHTIGNDTEVELVNDQAVLFAKHGFAIGAVSGQSVTIYSIGAPDASVTLEVVYNG